MNLKNLSFGLALTGLGVLALTTQAQAYEFNFLGTSNGTSNLRSNNNTYHFELVTNGPTDIIEKDDQLSVSGFEGISNIELTTYIDNVPGVLLASDSFETTSHTSDNSVFTATANFAGITRDIRYQTFSITAANVPSGFVNATFRGNSMGPTPVPEPLTILGSLAALGFGSRCQKEFAKKKSANSEETLEEA